ncbi:LysR family transcriptional regulator [Micromonospora avicenniae]
MVGWDFRRLRFLREFEERGTLGAVAAALGYSPSTVSQQMALLERDAGTRANPAPSPVRGRTNRHRSAGSCRASLDARIRTAPRWRRASAAAGARSRRPSRQSARRPVRESG